MYHPDALQDNKGKKQTSPTIMRLYTYYDRAEHNGSLVCLREDLPSRGRSRVWPENKQPVSCVPTSTNTQILGPSQKKTCCAVYSACHNDDILFFAARYSWLLPSNKHTKIRHGFGRHQSKIMSGGICRSRSTSKSLLLNALNGAICWPVIIHDLIDSEVQTIKIAFQ